MSFLGALLDPSHDTNKGYKKAKKATKAAMAVTDPFYTGQIGTASSASTILANLLGLNGAGVQGEAIANFSNSPAYEAQLAQGTRAIDQSAASRGMSLSGATLKALQGYGQDLYNQDYQQYLSNLSGQVSGGYAGASGLMNNANQIGQLYVGQGMAKDAGNAAMAGNILGIGSSILGGLSGLGGIPGMGGLGSPMQIGAPTSSYSPFLPGKLF